MLEALILSVLIICILAYVLHATSDDLKEFCTNCGRDLTEIPGYHACPDCGHLSDF